jgi:hypothetical protein
MGAAEVPQGTRRPGGWGRGARAVVAAVMLLPVAAGIASAQQAISTGTITGIVQDEQGLPIPGAVVEVTNLQTQERRSTVSNASGNFNVAALVIGRYKVSVTLAGFGTVERVDIPLQSNEIYNTGTVTMKAGITETVTVTADPIGVQTTTAVRTSVLDTSTIDSLVSRGRDPVRLLNSLPGVDPQLGGAAGAGLITGGTIGTNLPTMQGTAGFASYVAIDGVGSADGDTGFNNGITSMDAIQEIRVVMNSYTAEFGRNTGPQINVVTKSGGQRYSGSLSTYIRHEALNSNTLANERLGLPKPIARYYTGVGTLGGPVALPGAGKLKRTFFFYAREMWNTKQAATPNTKQMPTAAERSGDFSQTVQTNGTPFFIRDPLRSGACSATAGGPGCFPGNVIPADRIDPLGRSFLNIFPIPNFSDISVSNRQYNFADTDVPKVYRTLDQVTFDHNFTDNDRISVKYRHWRPNRESTTNTFGINSNWNHFRSQYAQKEDAVTANYTRTITGQLVSETSFGYRNTPEVAPVDTMPEPISKLQRGPNGLGALGSLYQTPTLNQLDLYPQLTFTGVPGMAPNVAWDARFPIDAIDLRWSLQNNLTWTAGRHLVKGGIYYEFNVNSEGFSATCFSGCLDFTSNNTTAAQNPFNTNHPYANALLGYYTTYAESNTRPFRGGQQWNLEWFVQDSWKVRSNLTLELGMRFASGTPWHLREDGWEGYNPPPGQRAAGWLADAYAAARNPLLYVPACAPPATTCAATARLAKNPLTGVILPNSVALIGQLVPNSGDFYNGLILDNDPRSENGTFQPNPGLRAQPRLGFSWDPTGRRQTAIRGGYGITEQLFDASGNFAGTFPSSVPVRLQPTLYYGSLSDLASVPAVFSPSPVTGWTYTGGRTRMTHNFSIEVQQNIGFNTVVSAAYVANRQRGLVTTRDQNLVPEGARFDPKNADPTSATGASLPDAFLRPIPQFTTVTERTREGVTDYDSMQVTANHRLSGGVAFGTAYTLSKTKSLPGALTVFLDPYERLYGYDATDRRHIFSYQGSWHLPNGSALWNSAVGRALLDGWQLAGVGFWRSGTPTTATYTTTDAGGTDTMGGGDPVRISMVAGCDPSLSRGERSEERWFDTSCFIRTPVGSYGDSPVNNIRQPGNYNLDLSMSKTFALGRGQRLMFRADAYNALKVNTRTVNSAATFDPQGRQINSDFGRLALPTDEARQIELSLKYSF